MTRPQPVASTAGEISPGPIGLWPDRRGGAPARRDSWIDAYRSVRAETERRAACLSAEDQVVQSRPDASPIKWHRAHTTWFFEQFVLAPHAAGYRSFDERFAYLFNSYYVAAGARHARPKRGLVTRPDRDEVARYRAHVMQRCKVSCSRHRATRSKARSHASKSGSITSSSTRN